MNQDNGIETRSSSIPLSLKHLFQSCPWRWLFSLFALAAIPRLLWAFAPHPPPFSDMEDYYLCAINFLKGSHLAMSPDRLAYRAPMYPLFLSACIQLFPGTPLSAIRIVQSFLGACSPLLLFVIMVRLMTPIRERTWLSFLRHPYIIPFLTALVFAWFASQIFFTSILMTETVFVFALLFWIDFGLRCGKGCPVWRLVLWSSLLGVLALIRPAALFFIPIMVIKSFQCIPRDKRLKTLWMPCSFWLIPILPWTIRNYLIFNAFVLISSNSGVNFFIGHNPAFGYYEGGYKEVIRQEYARQHGPSEVGEDRLFLRIGLDFVREHPMSLVSHSWWKFYFLYLLDKDPWPWEEYNRGQGLILPVGISWPFFKWNRYLFVLSLIGVGYAFIRKLPHGLLLSVLGSYTLSCLVFFARTRFRIPMEPFLIAYASLGILSLVELTLWGYGSFLTKRR